MNLLSNYFGLFNSIRNPKQLEGLRLLVTRFATSSSTPPTIEKMADGMLGIAYFDCHINGPFMQTFWSDAIVLKGIIILFMNKTLNNNIEIPDSKLASEITEFVRDTEPPLLFNHSTRVYLWADLTGQRRGLHYDRELLYAGAMFHDIGLTRQFNSATERFEVDGANAASDFLKSRGIPPYEVDLVWTSIALHTTPGIPPHMHPVIALMTAGVLMDVLGTAYDEFSDPERKSVVSAFPRTPQFKEDFIQAFYDGLNHKPETTYGTLNADYLADKDKSFKRMNVCNLIRNSAWPS